MNGKGPISFALNFAGLLLTPGIILVYFLAGIAPAVTFAIGDTLSTLSLRIALFTVRRIVTPSASKVPTISKLQLILLIKLPIFAAVVWVVNGLGRVPLFYFLAGYLLVYFGLFVGAIYPKISPRYL